MIDNKRLTPFIALFGAMALMTSAPVFAQQADPAAAAAPAAEAPAAAAAAPADAAAAAAGGEAVPETLQQAMGAEKGEITPFSMFQEAVLPVQVIMLGLIIVSIISWIIFGLKMFEFAALNRTANRFVEAFRSAKSISEMGKISMSDEFEGNPLADMAAAAAQEVELSRQAGLAVNGQHRETTINRAYSAVGAVQGQLSKRLSSGMQFLASTGAISPFVGLLGTVYGIMNSFIGIVKSQSTSLTAVAPGIAEALLATGIGLFAAIPAVVFYNLFQSRIQAFGTRTEGFVAELMNAISRQLDKGA